MLYAFAWEHGDLIYFRTSQFICFFWQRHFQVKSVIAELKERFQSHSMRSYRSRFQRYNAHYCYYYLFNIYYLLSCRLFCHLLSLLFSVMISCNKGIYIIFYLCIWTLIHRTIKFRIMFEPLYFLMKSREL